MKNNSLTGYSLIKFLFYKTLENYWRRITFQVSKLDAKNNSRTLSLLGLFLCPDAPLTRAAWSPAHKSPEVLPREALFLGMQGSGQKAQQPPWFLADRGSLLSDAPGMKAAISQHKDSNNIYFGWLRLKCARPPPPSVLVA